MKRTYLLLLLSIFMLSNCSSDDDDVDGIEITATMRCVIKGTEIAEHRAPLILFTYFKDFDNYVYNTSGYFEHKDTKEKKLPTKKAISDNTGFVRLIDTMGANDCVVVIQSSQYPDQYEIKHYPKIKDGSRIQLGTFTFTD